jgi:hypothetical protein
VKRMNIGFLSAEIEEEVVIHVQQHAKDGSVSFRVKRCLQSRSDPIFLSIWCLQMLSLQWASEDTVSRFPQALLCLHRRCCFLSRLSYCLSICLLISNPQQLCLLLQYPSLILYLPFWSGLEMCVQSLVFIQKAYYSAFEITYLQILTMGLI